MHERSNSHRRAWLRAFEGEVIGLSREQLEAVLAIAEQRRWTTPELASVTRPLVDEDGGAEGVPRRPIEVVSTGQSPAIRFNDRFGIVHLPGLSIEVLPKIDRDGGSGSQGHMGYLYRAYAGLPTVDRVAEHTGASVRESSSELVFLVIDAFVTHAECLMRDALLRGYELREEWLASPRGSIEPLETARAVYSGRLQAACVYEEFCDDTPLNRVVKEALRLVLLDANRLGLAGGRTARRVRPMLELMQDVNPMRISDMAAEADRLTARYEPCLSLAKDVIDGFGRALGLGSAHSVSFLFQSSTVAEVGVRSILSSGLRGWRVTGRPIRSRSGEESYNPDLVFERNGEIRAVGDVKYKIIREHLADWRRSMRADLNQAIAFATAARVSSSVVVGFWNGRGTPPLMQPATPGPVTVNYLTWNLAGEPAEAASDLVDAVTAWLDSVQ